MSNVRLPADWLRTELADAAAETAKWPLWKRKACGLEPLDEADRLANGDLGRGNLIRSYGEQCRRAGAAADVEKICRAICKVEGLDPDELMQEYETEAHGYRPTDPIWTKYVDAVMSALPSAAEAASPAAGWRTVPIEPTGAMLMEAWHHVGQDLCEKGRESSLIGLWKAMLEAAPSPSEGRGGAGWTPIADEAKDGRRIEVYGQPDNTELLRFTAPAVYIAFWNKVDGNFNINGGVWVGPTIKPTHYRDLPSPPSADGQAASPAAGWRVPDGWKLVPIEPSLEMVVAGDTELENCKDGSWDSGPHGESHNSYEYIIPGAQTKIYRAMIEAAPSPSEEARAG